MAWKYLETAISDNIGRIVLNRPEKMNAMGLGFEEEMIGLIRQWSAGREVKVAIISARGRMFSSGHDRDEILAGDPESLRALFRASQELMLSLRQAPFPVIAQVHGTAMAGGCHLVAGCDLAVAAREGARFGLIGTRIGYNCSTPTVAVSRAVGRRKCLEMLLTGRLYPAEEALAMGLVNLVVDDDKLEEATLALAREVAAGSRTALALAKEVFYAQVEMTEDQAYRYAREMMAVNAMMPDAREGFAAGIARRKPVFPGG